MKDILQTIEGLSPNKAILLVDADEVLLQFIVSLEQFLPTIGLELRLDSFSLSGNIYVIETGKKTAQENIKPMLDRFFAECVDNIPAVQGATESLSRLSEYYQILVLTNIPQACRERRRKSLTALGIDYPVIANKGEKGPIVKMISEYCRGKTAFIDDLPPHHSSVAHHSPSTHRIHFVADKRLSKLLPTATDAHHRFECWPDITDNLIEWAQS